MYIFVDSGFEDGNMDIDSDSTLPVSDAENSLITTTTGATGVSGVPGVATDGAGSYDTVITQWYVQSLYDNWNNSTSTPGLYR